MAYFPFFFLASFTENTFDFLRFFSESKIKLNHFMGVIMKEND